MVSMATELQRPKWLTRLTGFLRSLRPRPSWHSVIKEAVQWGEVVSVFAFKRDVFAYDLICFVFKTGERFVELREDMEGWDALIDALPAYLSGAPGEADWWNKIVQPPFATNWTTLYTRS